MNIFIKSTLVEKIIFVSAFIVFCGSLAFLVVFNRIFARPIIDPADIIAKVAHVSNSVRRRTPVMFEFAEIWPDDPIGNGDTIYSGDHSQISILFTQGSALTIGANSLVVIRMIDGKLEIKVEKGHISAKLKEGLDVEIQSEEDSITLRGSQDTEFDLLYLPKLGLEMKKIIKTKSDAISKRDQSDDEPAKPNQAKVDDATALPSTIVDTPPSQSKQKVQALKVKGFTIDEDIKMKPKKYSLKTPYPADNTVVLHQGEFLLPIFPKAVCESSCHLDIYLEGQKYYSKDFSPHNVPILYIKIAKFTEGKLRWSMKDSETETSGQFEILQFNDGNFANALKQKRAVEVVD